MAVEAGGTDAFDYKEFYKSMSDSERIQLSRDEVDWVQGFAKPDRTADVMLALSCGAQTVPSVMLTEVAVFKALGIDYVATAGQAYCCGNILNLNGRSENAHRAARNSMNRFAAWEPKVNVQCCGSCYNQFSRHADDIESETGQKPFEVVQLSRYIRRVLEERGDSVPWKPNPTRRRVLVHAEGAEVSPNKAADQQAIIETLEMVPGLEYVGLAEYPSLGPPCKRIPTNGAPKYLLDDITPEQYRQVQDELYEQAQARGADIIVTPHHSCHREWCKFGSERLPIVYYLSLVAEALGIYVPDRFQVLWRLGDEDKVLEMTRPYWESWGIEEAAARGMVQASFVPEYAAAVQKCPCEGNCFETTIDTDIAVEGRSVA